MLWYGDGSTQFFTLYNNLFSKKLDIWVIYPYKKNPYLNFGPAFINGSVLSFSGVAHYQKPGRHPKSHHTGDISTGADRVEAIIRRGPVSSRPGTTHSHTHSRARRPSWAKDQGRALCYGHHRSFRLRDCRKDLAPSGACSCFVSALFKRPIVGWRVLRMALLRFYRESDLFRQSFAAFGCSHAFLSVF